MIPRLQDIPLDRTLTEHYLFGLDLSVKKTAEILDMDEDLVRQIHDDYMRCCTTARRRK